MIIEAIKALGVTEFACDARPTKEAFESSYRSDSALNPSITWDQVKTKLVELQAAEPMRILREERNVKLAKTDWWSCSDLTMTQSQKDYRKALRDLPATAEPKSDENRQLTNVTWPEKPE